MSDYRYLRYEPLDDGAIVRIVLDRPRTRNAQSRGLLVELDAAFTRAEADDDVRVVILSGAGSAFSSGHDLGTREALAEIAAGPEQHPTYAINGGTRSGTELRWIQESHYFLQNTLRWRNLRKITIAQVHGEVFAAGVMLMWACDLIVAGQDTRIADPVGPRLGGGGVEYFAHPWELGPRRAKELLLTGDAIDAEEAQRIGIVSKVFANDQLEERTLAFARRIAALPTVAALVVKDSVNGSVDAQGFQSALNNAFALHQLAHSHWAELHATRAADGGRETPVGERPERAYAGAVATVDDGIPDWRSAPPVVVAVKDEVRASER
ncbi:enoyl-CoA hydratase [Conexibacter stalactiti]|uniref:Enoyl-CoA hydratase n=1 Tax=Conexibacter stalactiti TaxID=1940611 RepID=A0ABU4HTE7_9ACTN|nr:enoyl-CoA hydratase [Conexibacter stalactiti]MDW5595790.1 enoyl-CoA hydratase [Conexibacter stalactiti]MEC5036432.1 enoyl-CoA hydratase [Conexibacter stalactiti]